MPPVWAPVGRDTGHPAPENNNVSLIAAAYCLQQDTPTRKNMTTKILHNITHNDGEVSSITAFIPKPDGSGIESFVANAGHANFLRIFEALAVETEDADFVRDLFDVRTAITHAFARLGERVTIKGETLYLDGDPLNGALAEAILTYYQEGNDDLAPLVRFLENLANNPNPTSRDSLYGWLAHKSFHIDDDGCFLTYKSVYSNSDDTFRSVHSGTADVNGVTQNGYITQKVGDVVEMPRSDVDDNTGQHCSTGLHVGTYRYANSFSGNTMLLVKVNPRDVVSVPNDGAEKVRVCRYVVVDAGLTGPHVGVRLKTEVVVPDPTPDPVDDEPVEDVPADDPIAPSEDETKDEVPTPAPATKSRRKTVAEVTREWLESRDRDTIRRLAREHNIVRGDKNKGELIDALLAVNYRKRG